jgi:hypothetical protein
VISVLLPSRGRLGALMASVTSLLALAGDQAAVEVLVAGDPDDVESIPAGWLRHPVPQPVMAWIAPRRYGYGGMHHYVNFLASQASGDWLMLWNDDARMLTAGWDGAVHSRQLSQVLWPAANHAEGGNLFPVWPKAWTDATGYVSRSPNCDVWVSEVGRRLGREGRIPVQVLHDRADITGGHDDATYAEGRAVMGAGNDAEYDSQENRLARARDIRVVTRLLAEQE